MYLLTLRSQATTVKGVWNSLSYSLIAEIQTFKLRLQFSTSPCTSDHTGNAKEKYYTDIKKPQGIYVFG